jgi:hypothetical protein
VTEPRLDELDLRRQIAIYADGVNRRDWDGLTSLFRPDATLELDLVDRGVRRLTGPAEILGFIAGAVERFDFFEFVALNVVVTVPADGDPDTARLRTFMCEIRHHGRNDPDAGAWTTAFGLYLDTVVRTDDGWRFAARRYRSLARTGEGGGVFPFPDLPPIP